MPRLVQYTHHDFGGHFPALENHKIFAEDIRQAVKAFVKARKNEDGWTFTHEDNH